MMKTSNKLEMENIFLHLIKGFSEKSTARIILTGERLTAFPSKIGKRAMHCMTPYV